MGPPGAPEHVPVLRIDPEELEETAVAVPPYAPCTADTPALAHVGSGTTGDRELYLHTHGGPERYALGLGAVVGMTPRDVCFPHSRPASPQGLVDSVLVPLQHGAATVLAAKEAGAGDALTVIEKYSVSVFSAPSTWYAGLLTRPEHRMLDSLRTAVVAGEPLPESLEPRLRALLGDRLLISQSRPGRHASCPTNSMTRPPSSPAPGWPPPPDA
jgi:fatty acid CoA ligase FadD22